MTGRASGTFEGTRRSLSPPWGDDRYLVTLRESAPRKPAFGLAVLERRPTSPVKSRRVIHVTRANTSPESERLWDGILATVVRTPWSFPTSFPKRSLDKKAGIFPPFRGNPPQEGPDRLGMDGEY
jgi:hypothetical protein